MPRRIAFAFCSGKPSQACNRCRLLWPTRAAPRKSEGAWGDWTAGYSRAGTAPSRTGRRDIPPWLANLPRSRPANPPRQGRGRRTARRRATAGHSCNPVTSTWTGWGARPQPRCPGRPATRTGEHRVLIHTLAGCRLTGAPPSLGPKSRDYWLIDRYVRRCVLRYHAEKQLIVWRYMMWLTIWITRRVAVQH